MPRGGCRGAFFWSFIGECVKSALLTVLSVRSGQSYTPWLSGEICPCLGLLESV